MLTEEQAKHLGKLIDAYKEAAIADSWKGGTYPEDVPIIEAELAEARTKLNDFIRELMGAPTANYVKD